MLLGGIEGGGSNRGGIPEGGMFKLLFDIEGGAGGMLLLPFLLPTGLNALSFQLAFLPPEAEATCWSAAAFHRFLSEPAESWLCSEDEGDAAGLAGL